MTLSPRLALAASLAFLFLAALMIVSATSGNGASAHNLTSPGNTASTVTWGPDIDVGGAGLSNDPNAFIRHKDQTIAVDPTNPSHIIASYVEIAAGYRSLYANSTDKGTSWSTGAFTDVQGTLSNGNVNIGFDGHGVGYYTTNNFLDSQTGIYLITTTTGVTWNTPVPVIVYGDGNNYTYNSNLAVDSRLSGQNAGNLYIYWQYNTTVKPYYQGIWGSYSRDSGVTWSAPAPVSNPEHYYTYGPDVKTASDGSVYVAFEDRPTNTITDTRELYLNHSTDGGVTWGGDKLIGGGPVTYIGGRDFKGRDLALSVVGPSTCTLLRINQFPTIAVSPFDPNTVYAVWNDGRWDLPYSACTSYDAFHADIAFSKTTDGGNTWTAPMRINDDALANGIDQFMPSIAVSASGKIGVTWYDRRYDPAHALYDLAYSESTDGGATWSANQRVSDESSDADRLPDYKSVDDIGVRKSLAYGLDYAIAGWLDTRTGPQLGEFFVDKGAMETAVPTDTPVSTVTPTPSHTAVATSTSIATTTRTSTATASVSVTGTPLVCTLQFEDVPSNSTFYPFVRCLACLGILNGYTCGGAGEPCNATNDPYFRPISNITRGQIAKVVSNAAGFTENVTGQTFEDVPPGSTFYTFVGRLASRGVMSGYPCGGAGEPCGSGNLPYFRPNNNATRGQISKLVAIAAAIQDQPGAQIFQDVQPGSTFYTYTQQLANRSVMSGYPCGGAGEPCVPSGNLPYFRPTNNATRGQTSKIVSNTFFPSCNQ